MNATPLVSVVLPTYNRAHLLSRSITSVIKQSFGDLELLVVDDGSTDDTENVVAGIRDPRIRYIRRDRNGGIAAARNTGVEVAHGRYLAFQDSDDEWLLDKLRQQVLALDGLADSAMCICAVLRIKGKSPGRNFIHPYPRLKADWENGLDLQGVLIRAVTYTQGWLVPRSAVVEIGGFNTSLKIWDDWEMLVRLSQRLRIVTLDESLVLTERREDSLSLDTHRFLHDMEHFFVAHAELLSRHPQKHAGLLRLHAERQWRAGSVQAARRAAIQSLALDAYSTDAWKLLWRSVVSAPRSKGSTRPQSTASKAGTDE